MKKGAVSLLVLISMGVGFSAGYMVFGMMHLTVDPLDAEMHGLYSDLGQKTGDAFDDEFLREMVLNHQGAIEIAEQAAGKSQRMELVQLAEEVIADKSRRIEQMRTWRTQWFVRQRQEQIDSKVQREMDTKEMSRLTSTGTPVWL